MAVTALVESEPFGLVGGGFDGADAAKGGEGRLAVQPLGVVAGRDEQRCGAVGADADAVEELRAVGGDRVTWPRPAHRRTWVLRRRQAGLVRLLGTRRTHPGDHESEVKVHRTQQLLMQNPFPKRFGRCSMSKIDYWWGREPGAGGGSG